MAGLIPGSNEARPSPKGRLAAVLTADAVGFSRYMELEPEAAIAGVETHRAAMRIVAAEHGGALVGSPGDFLLAVFPGAESAVEAAFAFIRRSKALRAAAPAQLEFRIGVDLGDVYEEAGEFLGAAINTASRLQQAARPSGILISQAVHDLLPGRSRERFRSRGPVVLRNIDRPVVAYEFADALDVSPPPAGQPRTVGGRPEIYIKGFEAIGHAERAGVFADGVTEELVATLGSLSAAFVFREDGGRSVPARGYVLSGKVRNGDRLRITAKLVRAEDGATVWAERYDFQPDASYDAQERIAQNVVTALQISLTEGEQARLWSSRTTSLAAWESFHRGRSLEARYRKTSHAEARRCYLRSIELDPAYVPAMVALGFCHLDELRLGWAASDSETLMEAERWSGTATQIDPSYPQARALAAFIEYARGRYAQALETMRRVAQDHPDGPEIVAYYAALLYILDRPAEAVGYYERAIAMMPSRPLWMASNLGFALLAIGRAEEADAQFRKVLEEDDAYERALIGLAIACSLRGDGGQAKRHAMRVLIADPGFRVERWARTTMFANAGQRESFAASLRAAGLP